MSIRKKALTLAAGVVLLAPVVSLAQQAPSRDLSTSSTGFSVRNMTFDLWCLDTQRYQAARCEARRPEDVRAFENYRSAIERYELNYLKQVQRDRDQRALTNRDPSQTVSGKQDGTP